MKNKYDNNEVNSKTIKEYEIQTTSNHEAKET